MQKKTVVVSGQIVIDDFHERLFLFVSASTQMTLDGKAVHAGSLPDTDREFTQRLHEGLRLDGRTFPHGSGSDHSAFSQFRIIRLLDDAGGILPEDFPAALEHKGDSSRAVTVAGHFATDEERSGHDDVTTPTITMERLVTFEAIQQRAFDISRSGDTGSAFDNWLRAERELVSIESPFPL